MRAAAIWICWLVSGVSPSAANSASSSVGNSTRTRRAPYFVIHVTLMFHLLCLFEAEPSPPAAPHQYKLCIAAVRLARGGRATFAVSALLFQRLIRRRPRRRGRRLARLGLLVE